MQITANSNITVFKPYQCAPCDTGQKCPNGVVEYCVPGTANSIVGSASCIDCEPGMVSDVGEWDCQLGRLGLPACLPASQPASGPVHLLSRPLCCLCQPNMRSLHPAAAGQEVCQQCPAGSLPTPARDTCALCPAGYYSTIPGLSSCTPCAAGFFRNAEADGMSCMKCPPGTWSDPAAGECTPCKPGTATDNEATIKDPETGSCPAW